MQLPLFPNVLRLKLEAVWRLKGQTRFVGYAEGLNFSMGELECWGLKATLDPLANFFIDVFERRGLLYVEVVKLNPPWQNRRSGEERITKRLDNFLVVEHLVLLMSF